MRQKNHLLAALQASCFAAMLSLAACGSGGDVTAPPPHVTAVAHLDSGLRAMTVFIAGNQSNQSGPATFVALNAATGKDLWHAPFDLTYTTPVTANGLVYMTSKDGELYALNVSNGATSWKVARGSQDDGYPTVASSAVYVASDSGSVLALDAATGAQRWRFQAPNANDHIYSAPAVAAGLVYVACGGPDDGLFALDAASGAVRWRASAQGDAGNGQPVVAEGAVYLTDSQGMVYAFDAMTGKPRWKVAIPSAFQAGAAVAGGRVYVGGENSTLYALDATSGATVWSKALGGSIGLNAPPAVANGVVYVGGSDSRISALNAASGAILWQKILSDAVSTTPLVAGDGVFVGDQSGDLYGLLASDGSVAWMKHIANTILASAVVG